MKRTLALILSLLLALSLLTGCGQTQSHGAPTEEAIPVEEDVSEEEELPAGEITAEELPAEESSTEDAPSDGMTDSYRAGRQAYYDLTGIWMPEAEGCEAEYEVNMDQHSIAFDARGDRALYEQAKAALTGALGDPAAEEENSAEWSVPMEDASTAHYQVIYHQESPEDIWVFMNVYRG